MEPPLAGVELHAPPAKLVGPTRVVAKHPGHGGDAAAGRSQRHALVAAFQPGYALGVLVEQVGDPPNDAGPLRARDGQPPLAVERGAGGAHRPVGVLAHRARDLPDDLLGARVNDVDHLSRLRMHPFAVD